MPRLKADLHTHTSDDPWDEIDYSAETLIDAAAAKRIDVLAITCHDLCAHSQYLAEYARRRNVLLVPGIELHVEGRHVIILNPDEEQCAASTFPELRALGPRDGVVVAPHPYYPAGRSLNELLVPNIDLFHAIEYSAFYFLGLNFNRKAEQLAREKGLPLLGSSDTHVLPYEDSTFTWIDAERSIQSVIEAIRAGRVKAFDASATPADRERDVALRGGAENSGSRESAAPGGATFVIERITVLGGSSVYTPEFIVSLISHNLNVKEVVLFGSEGQKLKLVSEFCCRLVKRSGFPCKVVASSDLEEAVRGAKYVVNHVRIGGMRARLRDEKLPPKQGMIGDESLGAGGFANALRTLPIVLDFAERIEKVNSDCMLINLSQPMGIVMEALSRYSGLRSVGVCEMPAQYVKKIAALLMRDPDELNVDYIGLNHMGWIQDVRINGRSCLSKVIECLETERLDGFDYELMDLFRMIPMKTVSLYFHRDEILKQQKSCARFRAEVLYEAEKQILKLYKDNHLTQVPDLDQERNAVWYEETLVPLIVALESNDPRTIILCLRNDGCIRDLPDECSVELPAEVSKAGIVPRKVGSCPHFLKGLFQTVKESDRLAVEAVRHKSYEYALQGLTIHPLVPSLQTARRFLDRVLKDEKVELH